MMNGPRIGYVGYGSYLPSTVVTNDDLSKMVDTSDEWITARTSIKSRHICSDEESTALLATKIAQDRFDIHSLEHLCQLFHAQFVQIHRILMRQLLQQFSQKRIGIRDHRRNIFNRSARRPRDHRGGGHARPPWPRVWVRTSGRRFCHHATGTAKAVTASPKPYLFCLRHTAVLE